MSLDATLWAWKQNIKPAQKLLLLSLADRVGENMECYPSIKRLELDTGLNRKTIISHLKQMCEDGLIADTEKRMGSTQQVKVYKMTLVEKREESNSPKNGTVPLLPPKGPKNGTPKESQKRYSESPIKEPINEPIKDNKSKMFYTALNTFEFPPSVKVTLEMFKENCRELGYKKTQRAWEMIFKKVSSILDKSGETAAVESINQAIERGYKSVFEPSNLAPFKKPTITFQPRPAND